jgi:hypothetical protein
MANQQPRQRRRRTCLVVGEVQRRAGPAQPLELRAHVVVERLV